MDAVVDVYIITSNKKGVVLSVKWQPSENVVG